MIKFLHGKKCNNVQKAVQEIMNYLQKLGIYYVPDANVSGFVKFWNAKWAKHNRTLKNVLDQNKEWLDKPMFILKTSPPKRQEKLQFEDLSNSQKRRRTIGNTKIYKCNFIG